MSSIPFVFGKSKVDKAPAIETIPINVAGSQTIVDPDDITAGRKIIANLAMILQHAKPVDRIVVGKSSTVNKYITVNTT